MGIFKRHLRSFAIGAWITVSSKHIYHLPAGTYDYMAAYHWVILMGICGIVYLFYFSNAGKRSLITWVEHMEAEEIL